jgi:hypothetical protein
VKIVMKTRTAMMNTILDVGKNASEEQVDRGGFPTAEVEVTIIEEGPIEGSVIDKMTVGKVAEQTPAMIMTMAILEPTDIERAAVRRLRGEVTSEVTRRLPSCLTRPRVSSSYEEMIGWTYRRVREWETAVLVRRGSSLDQEKRCVLSFRTTLGRCITDKD